MAQAMNKVQDSEFCRGLILENGCTIGLFSSCHVIVLEPDGTCFSVLEESRDDSAIPCESHAVRFAPKTIRPLVALTLRFRNTYTDDPYIPQWMGEITKCERMFPFASKCKSVAALDKENAVAKQANESQITFVHWPTEYDSRYIHWTLSGGVEVSSLDGKSKFSLCHLGKTISVSFPIQPTEENNPVNGYNTHNRKLSLSHQPTEENNPVNGYNTHNRKLSLSHQPTEENNPVNGYNTHNRKLSLSHQPTEENNPVNGYDTHNRKLSLSQQQSLSNSFHTQKKDKSSNQSDQRKHKIKNKNATINQLHSIRHIPSCFVTPAKLALSVFHMGYGLKDNVIHNSQNSNANQSDQYQQQDDPLLESKVLPKYIQLSLPSSSIPSTPQWKSIDSTDGLYLFRINENKLKNKNKTFQTNKSKITNCHKENKFDKEEKELQQDYLYRLLPSELISLAKRAILNHSHLNKNSKFVKNQILENDLVDGSPEKGGSKSIRNHELLCHKEHNCNELAELEEVHIQHEEKSIQDVEESYPVTRHCSVVEWSPRATYRAFKMNSSRRGGGNRNADCIVEVNVHLDDSMIVVEGEYAIHFSSKRKKKMKNLHNQPYNHQDLLSQKETESSSSSSSTSSLPNTSTSFGDSFISEKVYHVDMADHIIINDTYRLGPYVRKAKALTIQFTSIHSTQQQQINEKQNHFFSNENVPIQPMVPLNDKHNSKIKLKNMNNHSPSSSIIYQKCLSHVTMTGYQDGSCRGSFHNRTLVSLQWIVQNQQHLYQQKEGNNIKMIATCRVVTPLGCELIYDCFSDGSISNQLSNIPFVHHIKETNKSSDINHSYIQTVFQFAKWFVKSDEEKAKIEYASYQRQILVSRERRNTSFFLAKEKFENELKSSTFSNFP